MSIIINGGGMTGAILALMLSKLTKGDLEISLIEQHSPYCYDTKLSSNIYPPHVIALSRGAYSELIRINMASILSSCSTVIKQVEISEYHRLHKIFINAQDYQLSELGYVIELNIFKKKLFDFLHKKSTVTVYCPATLQKIKRGKKNNIIILNNGHQIISKLMVAADGTDSTLASNCGIKWFRWNYQQTAIVSKITTEIPHFGRAFEKFTEHGPLAILPIANDFSFLIWCISDKQKKEVSTWKKDKFSQELQNVFGWKLGKILDVGKRYFYDLWLTRANSHISHRLALVGNAAQSLHPIAGQGFNLGLRDIVVLSKIITQALYQNVDIGDYSVLNTYQKHRYLDQYRTITITDGLVRLFSNHCLPLIIARSMGLFFVHYSTFLRRLLVNTILNWKTD
ncbi:2-octaprenyl-6-methoxyphenyl hydroxylase [Blochmannia endosymbiont of Camponotus sp. C-046]|uniref:2-octaprenyl-6-methoxyphenyl hydroxylase n=1 Tax=Blochmannia endosymbiont of Camponotus sp. C-046 TaxID=2945589 RepID=UPI0020246E62|nr:2-octaprenyl-6-methoxyphenyl hydroxylase [Blochmannia endosymbiont of Camponotus sp. C-046]URJ29020.1 2-octaprenyl-6-methoxyphenyl hydroxylase [Blochmannia endosymbiont of Camponotus sp. C-046]